MKIMKKIAVFAVIASTFISCVSIVHNYSYAQESYSFDVAKYNLTWNTPSTRDDDSMPLGNGDIGINLWTENKRDMVFYISKVGAFNNSMQTIKLGRVRVRFPENTFTETSFQQTLDLSTGSIKITSNDLNLEFWIDANAPVIHIKGENGTPIDVSASFEIDWNKRYPKPVDVLPENNTDSEDVVLNDETGDFIFYHRNSASQWASQAQTRYITSEDSLSLDPVKNLTFGGMICGSDMSRTDDLSISASDIEDISISIPILSCQPDTPQEFADGLRSLKNEIETVPYTDAYNAHVNWWSEYWDNSYIELTDGTVQKPARWTGDESDLPYIITQNYLLQRFIQGATMRGEHLVPFNGSIFNVENDNNTSGATPDTRAWDGLPIMWQNTRAPYWSTITSGDYEQTETLIHYLYKSLPVLKEGAKKRFNIDGAYLTEPMNPYGVPAYAYKASHLANHFTATTEIPLLMVRYYQHTRNMELFKSEIMPFVEACLDFFNNRFPENDSDGKMIMYPVNSLESGMSATNSTSIVAPLTSLLNELLALDDGSLTELQLEKIRLLRERMPEISTRSKEGVDFIAQEKSRTGIYHGIESPELYTVWPADTFAGYKTDGLDIARQTYAARTKDWDLFGDSGKVDITGGWNQGTIFSAKLGLPYETAYLLTQCATNTMDKFDYNSSNYDNGWIPSRFPAFWGPNYDWKPDQCHGGNLMTAFQAMLLQYDENGNIYLMNSWPEDWDVNFRLHAPNNTVVTAQYKDGVLNYTTNNSNENIIDLSTEKNRIINRVSVACADRNYIFLKEPILDGKYDVDAISKYSVTGDWLKKYGFTVNNTVGTSYGWNDWGGATWNRETNEMYLHLIDFDGEITLPQPKEGIFINAEPVCVTNESAKVELQSTSSGITVLMDKSAADDVDTIIKLSFKPIIEYDLTVGTIDMKETFRDNCELNCDGWTGNINSTKDGDLNVYKITASENRSTIASVGSETLTDYTVKAKIRMSEIKKDFGGGLIFRHADDSNFVTFRLSGTSASNMNAELIKFENGTSKKLTSVPYTFNTDDYYDFKVDVSGNTVTAYINDNAVLENVDIGTAISYGNVGLRVYSGTVDIDEIAILEAADDVSIKNGTVYGNNIKLSVSNEGNETECYIVSAVYRNGILEDLKLTPSTLQADAITDINVSADIGDDIENKALRVMILNKNDVLTPISKSAVCVFPAN